MQNCELQIDEFNVMHMNAPDWQMWAGQAGQAKGEELTIISKYNKQKHSDIKRCMTATATTTATTIASCMFAVLLLYSYFVFCFFLIMLLTILPRGRESERERDGPTHEEIQLLGADCYASIYIHRKRQGKLDKSSGQ